MMAHNSPFISTHNSFHSAGTPSAGTKVLTNSLPKAHFQPASPKSNLLLIRVHLFFKVFF
uniref:Uncharacterized protein n=1 Tax=Anguilla anguilla TaxID=7936 RepID=A0A0E9SPZ1_ANGAN